MTAVTVTADDGYGGTAEQTFGVEVPNRPPIAVSSIGDRTLAPGERFTQDLTYHFADTDGDTLTVTATAAPAGVVAVTVEDRQLEVVGASRGRTEVTVTADDGHGGTAKHSFDVRVTNGAPSFGADAYEREVAENSAGGTAVGDPVTATDGDGDDLTYGFVGGGDDAPFEIGGSSGRITVAADAVLDYESTATVFTVSVEASDGTLADTAAVTIRVTDVPAPGRPDAPVVTGGAEQVAVSWSAPANEGPAVTNYDLRYRAKADGAWTDVSGLGSVLKHAITGLEAGAAYLVQVRAESSEGVGAWSESGEGTAEAANKAPSFDEDAYERSVPENSAGGTVVGDPVTATDGDGDDVTYSFLAGGAKALFEIEAATGLIAVAEGAVLDYESGDRIHELRVVASDGTLADTAAVTIRVTDVPAPGRPDAPVVTGGVEQVSVSWSAPSNTGPAITSYDLRYRGVGGTGAWTDVSGLGSVLTHTIAGLDAGTTYTVQVRAESSEGASEWSESGEGTTAPANKAPSFDADAYERSVPENSAAGTAVGEPVTATDADGDDVTYSFVAGGGDAPFEIDGSSGRITVAADAALDYESGDTVHEVRVVASDGTLADTAAVTIRVANGDDPGRITLSPEVARTGKPLVARLVDQDGPLNLSVRHRWEFSADGGASWTAIPGAPHHVYVPLVSHAGKWLRVVFTYTDGHGPGKRAESAAIAVVGAFTPVVSFGAESYTVASGGSADIAVLLSPAASSALAVEVVAGDSTHTVTFQSGASSGGLAIGTAGLSASDTLDVRFGTLPEGVVVGVPATTRIVVAAVAGDRVSRSVVQDGSPTELEVEYAQAAYAAVAGGPGTEILLRVSPAADRRVAVPLTATHAVSAEPALPDSVVFEPGDSVAAFRLDVPAGTAPGLLALGFGALPEAVGAGAVASATVDIAAPDTGALDDEAFDVGLAVLGRAVAEGAQQAIGARIDAVMRPEHTGSAAPGSAAEWAGRAAGTLASVAGLPVGASSPADMAPRSGSLEPPTGREAAERLLPRVSFATALGPQNERGRPRIGLWAEGSTQSFRGEPGGIGYDGGLRALTVGADARIGSSALLGVSVMRSDGDLDYGHRSADRPLGHAMNSVHPYLFLQPSPRIGLWAMAGYGSGDVGDDDRNGDSGASLRMLSGGVRVPLARTGALGLALTGDAFTVGMRADADAREGSASRARALLEASWTSGGLSLTTQAGARYDGGDADTGAGAETGASVGYAGHGLDLDLRGRLALGSGRHREWGTALRLAFDPGTRGEGFRLAVSPRNGRDQSGVHGLMDGGTFQTMTPATRQNWRLDAEAGYGLKNPGGGALDGYTRLSAGAGNRAWSLGTGYRVSQTMRLGIEGSRTLSPGQPGGLALRLALDYKF